MAVQYKTLQNTARRNRRVGDDGSVWTKGFKQKEWKRLRPSPTIGGYLTVQVRSTRPRCAKVHHVVLEAFVGPCPPGMEGCHKDNNPANNKLSNLRWGTPKSNCAERNTARGEALPFSKVTEKDVREIRKMRGAGATYMDIHRAFGIWHPAIYGIIHRTTWRHVA